LRVLFAASAAIAAPCLQALSSEGGGGAILAGVLTKADSPKGRGGRLSPTEIALAAQALPGGLPVLKPAVLDGAAMAQVAALKPDILVSFAYGKIFQPDFLSLFPYGGINVHPSLLPKYRGPSPIQAAILNRDAETGLSIQYLAAEVDSGDILFQDALKLDGRETAASLSQVMAEKAAAALPALLRRIAAGEAAAAAQNHSEATYCRTISSEQARINWGEGAAVIDAQIRAFDPWPPCWTLHQGRKLFILKAQALSQDGQSPGGAGLVLGAKAGLGILIQTGDGILAAQSLQFDAKKALEWRAFLNGARNFTGSTLG